MNSILAMIRLIEPRPAMYIGRNSISCLKAFLDGWYLRNTNTVSDIHVLDGFQLWIESKYNIPNTHAWDRIILFYSQDEAHALEQFFLDFNEFMSERPDLNNAQS